MMRGAVIIAYFTAGQASRSASIGIQKGERRPLGAQYTRILEASGGAAR